MASSIITPVTRLKNIRHHPNADKLDICDVLGYQLCIRRDAYKEGHKVVYFAADSILPDELIDDLGVRDFMRGKEKNRVGKIKLRGEPSFGLIADLPEGVDWQEGENVADYYGVKKYEPPIRATAEDIAAYNEKIDPFIEKYTNIENGRLHKGIFNDREEIIITEKLHGTNSVLSFIKGVSPAASSHTRRRKMPLTNDEMRKSLYWYPYTLKPVANLIKEIGQEHNISIYGEIYGRSIQSLDYGIPKGQGLGYRAFDIMIDGRYLDYDEFDTLCSKYGIPIVPLLYKGPFSEEIVKQHTEGQSTIIGANHIREGIVVKPVRERSIPIINRVILKYISTEYSLSKHQEKDTTDV